MGIPITQKARIGKYIISQILMNRKRFPLVLMLEPLFRCNLCCKGCGKVNHPAGILRNHLSVEECVGAAEECRAPVVSIAGGESVCIVLSQHNKIEKHRDSWIRPLIA